MSEIFKSLTAERLFQVVDNETFLDGDKPVVVLAYSWNALDEHDVGMNWLLHISLNLVNGEWVVNDVAGFPYMLSTLKEPAIDFMHIREGMVDSLNENEGLLDLMRTRIESYQRVLAA